MAVAEGKTVETLRAQGPAKQFQRGDMAIPEAFHAPMWPYARRGDLVMMGSGLSGEAAVIPKLRVLWAHPRAQWVEPEPLFYEYFFAHQDPVSTPVFMAGQTFEAHGTTPIPQPAWQETTAQQLFDLLALQHDWDSNASDAPSLAAAVEAFRFLARVLGRDAVSPSVVPLSGGGVQLEWHRRGTDVEVILGPVDDRGIYIENATGSWEGSVDDPADVAELAGRLTEVAAVIDG